MRWCAELWTKDHPIHSWELYTFFPAHLRMAPLPFRWRHSYIQRETAQISHRSQGSPWRRSIFSLVFHAPGSVITRLGRQWPIIAGHSALEDVVLCFTMCGRFESSRFWDALWYCNYRWRAWCQCVIEERLFIWFLCWDQVELKPFRSFTHFATGIES